MRLLDHCESFAESAGLGVVMREVVMGNFLTCLATLVHILSPLLPRILLLSSSNSSFTTLPLARYLSFSIVKHVRIPRALVSALQASSLTPSTRHVTSRSSRFRGSRSTVQKLALAASL